MRNAVSIAALLTTLLGLGVSIGREPARAQRPAAPSEGRDERDREALANVARALSLAALATDDCPVVDDPFCGQPASDFAHRLAQVGRRFLVRLPQDARDDCSGFVGAVLSRTGVPVEGAVVHLWDMAVEADALHWNEVPRVGDLVFFDNTYDRNHNRRWDDELSHIGLVIDVEPDGTFVVGHGGTSRGRTTMRMNLKRPHDRVDERGRILNQPLREGRTGSELWTAFATVDPDVWNSSRAE